MTNTRNIDLRQIAREAMQDRGFEVDFPPAVLEEVHAAAVTPQASGEIRDLTALLWSSIDNDDSKDLDQIEYSEGIPGGARVYVGIADVGTLVKKGSATDAYAQHNTTSVYTGVEIFPMLPQRFSTDLTSLNEGEKRLAFVVEMEITDQADVTRFNVYRALVVNKAQLTYNGVYSWLENSPPPYSEVTSRVRDKITQNPKLEEQLIQQDRVAQLLRRRRIAEGALDFQTAEVSSTIKPDGKIELGQKLSNRATRIIEEFMIASNESVDAFLRQKNFPCLERIVRTPKNWPRMVELAAQYGGELPEQPNGIALQKFLAEQHAADPAHFADLSLSMIKLLGRGEYVAQRSDEEGLGHFGLAASNYSHTTAPNRRYPDLITQRLLESAIKNSPPAYSIVELQGLASYCTLKEDDANKVERRVKKSIAAVALSSNIGKIFDGIITGASEKGVFVRVLNPPVEGKIEGKIKRLKVGDHVKARLVHTNPYRGFIDFEVV